jgi:hypothetical protein
VSTRLTENLLIIAQTVAAVIFLAMLLGLALRVIFWVAGW